MWLWIQCSMFCLLCRVSVTIRVWLSTIHLHAAKSFVGGRETSCCRQTTDNVQRLLLRPSHPQQAAPGRRGACWVWNSEDTSRMSSVGHYRKAAARVLRTGWLTRAMSSASGGGCGATPEDSNTEEPRDHWVTDPAPRDNRDGHLLFEFEMYVKKGCI